MGLIRWGLGQTSIHPVEKCMRRPIGILVRVALTWSALATGLCAGPDKGLARRASRRTVRSDATAGHECTGCQRRRRTLGRGDRRSCGSPEEARQESGRQADSRRASASDRRTWRPGGPGGTGPGGPGGIGPGGGGAGRADPAGWKAPPWQGTMPNRRSSRAFRRSTRNRDA